MFMLKVGPRTGILDHRSGTNRWGHALHAPTWHEEAPRVTGHLWWKRSFRRTSVMIHSSDDPVPGDTLLYTAAGGDRAATIVDVQPCFDPRDMFKLVFEDIRPAEPPITAQTERLSGEEG